MSIVVCETSPRALLDSALQLSHTLNLMSDEPSEPSTSQGVRGPGFVLHEVERVLAQVCKDLDMPTNPALEGTAPPLMMRLRAHIDTISSVLTGNPISFANAETTTLYELIESLSMLNRSVNAQTQRQICTIS